MQIDRPPAKGIRAPRWLPAFRVLGGAVILVICVIGLRRADWPATGACLAGASVPLVLLGAFAGFVQLLLKALRFQLLLAPVQRLSLLRHFYYLVVSFAASMIVPGPSSATLRVYVLKRRHDVPVAASLAVLLFEKLFDGIGLILVVAQLPFFLALPRAVSLATAAFSLGGVVVAAALVLVVHRADRRGYTGHLAWASQLSPGAACVRSPSIFARAWGLSLLSHLVDCVAIHFLLQAVGVDLPWVAGGLLILALSFALILPLTPMHLGALEAGAVGALGLLGTPTEKAIAFGLIYHSIQSIPVLVLGLTGFDLVSEVRAERAHDTSA